MEIQYFASNLSTVTKNGNTFSRTANNDKIAWFIFTANGDLLMLDYQSVGKKLEKEFQQIK